MIVPSGTWALDAPGPSPNPAENSIYFDHAPNQIVTLFGDNQVNIYDRPTDQKFNPQLTEQGAVFKTYIVCDGKINWEISWKWSCKTVNGKKSCGYSDFSGRATNQLAGELNTPELFSGFSVEKNSDGVPVLGPKQCHRNPFFQKQ